MDAFINNIGIIIYAMLTFTPPLIYAALGSCFSESSGIINIGIEGMMTAGAFAGAAVGHYTGNGMVAFFAAGIAGGIFGLLHALACVSLKADQTISGTAVNFLAPGISLMLSKALFNSSDTPPLHEAGKLPMLFANTFNGSDAISGFFRNIFSTYVSVYLAFIAVIIVWFVFYKTTFGMRLRAVGEHPLACATLGVNVKRIRYTAVVLSGFLAGLGGGAVTLAVTNQFRPISIVGQGFIAIAAVIFGKFKPQGAMLACMLFGLCTGVKVIAGTKLAVSPQLISMIPYAVTIIVLVLFVGKSRVPAASGKPF